ncbi:MAG: putative SUMO-activating enzyme subunit uba-2 [Streblomastix strix]|uniref:Putative SUMO-activating enzyme subunit uba-2 n=1 Tax=Streblomastix strix TaxID=222440 RepID=A0A5J4UT16_9EUKA|nr:MAG: putative SUMO-activating enzyme subunit uba-2 [Streblomastix strix]
MQELDRVQFAGPDIIRRTKLLVLGAGGIGCELLKSLVLTGFRHYCVIDLDTIDVSNLNRQFLFRREHVGKKKAEIAGQAILKMAPDATVITYSISIMDPQFDIDFYKSFDIVLLALDNVKARMHVNKMCCICDIPIVDAGSSGLLGHVISLLPGVSECFACTEKQQDQEFAICTIRGVPTLPIHTIMWGKLLYKFFFLVQLKQKKEIFFLMEKA